TPSSCQRRPSSPSCGPRRCSRSRSAVENGVVGGTGLSAPCSKRSRWFSSRRTTPPPSKTWNCVLI
ncbi:40S ribosomal protein S6, partial [Durusdinium trenchii]